MHIHTRYVPELGVVIQFRASYRFLGMNPVLVPPVNIISTWFVPGAADETRLSL